ncbi:hypothetical protein E8E13_000132 [Curvularia kusanoi]|uniref:Bacteriophage T5 Orf172 DNA-binding domain-containing protein n=1 Tax=Curvularia kusanoi TaxID=90978 RepID=A0A9P4T4F3_CURKU|nr:hypothetical protein E8E13_000132 [Curvularia kusanoi]
MAFVGRTPESLLPRSDSRNPATTCKGITKSGRPCRRPIDAKVSDDDGVLAIVPIAGDSDSDDIGAAAYFCWQHKDQAERLAATKNDGPDTQLYPLKERSSIDTLVQRLGVLEVDDTVEEPRRKRWNNDKPGDSKSRITGRINRPPTWNQVEGPLMSVPSDIMAAQKKRRDDRLTRPPPQRKKPGFWRSLCCGAADDDEIEAARRKNRKDDFNTTTPLQPMPQTPPRGKKHHSGQPSTISVPTPSSSQHLSGHKPATSSSGEATGSAKVLQYIPQDISPQLASTLLAELSKPISPHDDEGYIYIFWLTPESSGPAPESTASTLLAPPARQNHTRRTSDVMRQYSVKQKAQTQRGFTGQRHNSEAPENSVNRETDTILLKIGRANNVHRRMNEWTRQCGYSLSLVRFYPYVSSTPIPSPQASPATSRRQSAQDTNTNRRASDTVRKVPTVMRVERMIHLELAEQRVMKKCEACGKQHQEWFEVEATRDGVKRVDEVIKRWVEWAERSNEER